MQSRRHFLKSIVAAALSSPRLGEADPVTALLPDENRLVDLPEEFGYRVVSRVGDRMSDGLRVPGRHDGMAAFSAGEGRVALVCNHELAPGAPDAAFADAIDALTDAQRSRFYDFGNGKTPGAGGTTTTIYNPASGETERQHLSLAGTEMNCAGGPTPWGSWLSCEECFERPGTAIGFGGGVHRDQRHGYVFEVDAAAEGLVQPRPIRQMGRFEHEAAVVHPLTGIVYMTEDRHDSLFYRYIPRRPGKLAEGGRLQALAVRGRPSMRTHNWSLQATTAAGDSLDVDWIDLDDVDSDDNDLRLRGARDGAATFARGEGLCLAGDALAFTCTIGGLARLGQVFVYQPAPAEGLTEERRQPGRLRLLVEAGRDTLLRNADNLTMAPWGDLVVCEDTDDHCRLVGVRPDGRQYLMLESAYSTSELAGVCFSPDGRTMFVNIQDPGTSIAVSGPWQHFWPRPAS